VALLPSARTRCLMPGPFAPVLGQFLLAGHWSSSECTQTLISRLSVQSAPDRDGLFTQISSGILSERPS
jgi:hypothetical protein